jgi:hypothetical protein
MLAAKSIILIEGANPAMNRSNEGGRRRSGLVRQEEDLAGKSSSGDGVPSVKADIFLVPAGNAEKAKIRAIVRRALKPSASVPSSGTVSAEEDLAGNPLTANPTKDSAAIIAVQPKGSGDAASPGDDGTTVSFALKLLKYFDLHGSAVTRRPVFIRTVAFGMLVAFSVSTLVALNAIDVVNRMTDALWAGLLLLVISGTVLGLGIWFVDRKHSN